MADDVTLDELLQRQQALVKKAETLQGENDGDRINAVSEELKEESAELERLAARFEEAERKRAGDPLRAFTEVVLTADQRERVANETGIDLGSILVPDNSGIVGQMMPDTQPQTIEVLALAEAKRRAAVASQETSTRAEIEKLLREVEQQASPDSRKEIERLRNDPAFLGGALHKK